DSHVSNTKPLSVAPLEQLLRLDEQHPSDLTFLADVNNEDAGYLFVTEEYDQRRLVVYRWEPGLEFVDLGSVYDFPEKGPAFVFIDLVDDSYYLGIAGVQGYCILLGAKAADLFPSCTKGELDIGAFARKGIFKFPYESQSQVKLVRDSIGQWFLLSFRSDPPDSNGDDYVDVYAVEFCPFSISPRLFSVHVFFPSGDTGFASTGTHYVEASGRLLLS